MLCIMLANIRWQRNILYVGLRKIIRDAISVRRGRYSCMIGYSFFLSVEKRGEGGGTKIRVNTLQKLSGRLGRFSICAIEHIDALLVERLDGFIRVAVSSLVRHHPQYVPSPLSPPATH
jgi:hypothetical protein